MTTATVDEQARAASVLLRPIEAELVRLANARYQAMVAEANEARRAALALVVAEYKVPAGAQWTINGLPEGGIVLSWPLPPEVERTLAIVPDAAAQ